MRTRIDAGDDIPEGSNTRGNNPPPPPTMAEVLMQIERNSQEQTVFLRTIAVHLAPRGEGGAARGDNFSNFLRTQPPIFTRAKDPLAADHWLRTIEQKLDLIRCGQHEKVLFASHQLQDEAGAWWQGHRAMMAADHRFTWDEFRTAFRAFHIPEGVMQIKRLEFLNLKQGNKSVMEYVHAFNYLAQYAPSDVDSDVKKRGCFYNGLSEEMQDKLSVMEYRDFNHLVDRAIFAEDKMNKLEAKKRKRAAPPPMSGGAQRPRPGLPPPIRMPGHGVPQPMWMRRPAPAAANVPRPPAIQAPNPVYGPCFNCGQNGHLSRNCPSPRRGVGAAAAPNQPPRPPVRPPHQPPQRPQ